MDAVIDAIVAEVWAAWGRVQLMNGLEQVGLAALALVALRVVQGHVLPFLAFCFQLPPPKVTVDITDTERADVLTGMKKMTLKDFNQDSVKLFDPSTCGECASTPGINAYATMHNVHPFPPPPCSSPQPP